MSVSGRTPWLIVLCHFRDLPAPNRPRTDFINFFTEAGAGTGGVFDYWRDVSYGTIDLTGSNVTEWLTMNKSFFIDGLLGRGQTIAEAIRLAQENGIDISRYYGILAVTDIYTDGGGRIPTPIGRDNGVVIYVDTSWGEQTWRWYNKCGELFNDLGDPPASCPRTGTHDPSESGNYCLARDEPGFPGQSSLGQSDSFITIVPSLHSTVGCSSCVGVGCWFRCFWCCRLFMQLLPVTASLEC